MNKNHFNAIILGLIFLISINSFGQIKQVQLSSSSLSQFEKIEWDIQLQEKWNNPFWASDIALTMEIKAPSGKTIILPCYYVSGKSGELSNWKARFSAQETGTYSCKFRLGKNNNTVSEMVSAPFSVQPSSKKGFLHKNNNWTFTFDNGEAFRGIGENICWEARSNDDSKYFKELHENPRFNYEFMLRKLASNGGNFTRIWMCSWNLPLEWKSVSKNTNRYKNTTEYFNPDAIAKIDRLLELSDSLGIFIMLTLDQAGAYSGIDWNDNNYNIKNSGFAINDTAFFVNEQAKEQYKNKLRYMIARWGYSPSIGAWEFFNEIDYLSFNKDTSNHYRRNAVVAWHRDMSSFLKKNDPYQHLVTTSISHRDVDGLNSVENIDFNQRHIYKNTSGIPSIIKDYTDKFKKPYVIGEFGYEWDWSKDFNMFAGDMDNDFKRGLWLGLFSPTPILPMSWWWEYFENRGMMNYFAGVRSISDQMLKAGKGNFEMVNIAVSQSEIESYSLKCGNTVFVYLYNPLNDKKTTSLEIACKTDPNLSIQLYNCDSAQYKSYKSPILNNNSIQLTNIELTSKSNTIIIVK